MRRSRSGTLITGGITTWLAIASARRCRSTAAEDTKFDTIMPGQYPDHVCQHVHYLVIAPGHKPLVTQLYFADRSGLRRRSPDKNFSKDPLVQSRELVRPVTIAGDPKAMYTAVSFELCLERR